MSAFGAGVLCVSIVLLLGVLLSSDRPPDQ